MNRLLLLALFAGLLPFAAQAQNGIAPRNPSDPIAICDPAGASTPGCFFPCTYRRRPADAPCVVPPKPTYFPVAEYTDKARKKRVQGMVLLQITIDADGKVTDAKVSRGLEPSLDKASVENARRWRFEPATLDGKPVAVTVPTETTFSLR